MLKHLFFTFLFLCTQNWVSAQTSPFVLKKGLDGSLLIAGLVGMASGYHLQAKVTPFTPQEVIGFQEPNLPFYHSFSTKYYSSQAEKLSTWGRILSPISLMPLLHSKVPKSNYITLGVIGLEVVAITSASTYYAKYFTRKARPFVYNNEVPLSLKLKRDAANSFFSGHVSITAAILFYSATVVQAYSFDKWVKKTLWYTAGGLTIAVALGRIWAGAHFLDDVLVAAIVGASCGVGIPLLHLNKAQSAWQLGFSTQPNLMAIGFKHRF